MWRLTVPARSARTGSSSKPGSRASHRPEPPHPDEARQDLMRRYWRDWRTTARRSIIPIGPHAQNGAEVMRVAVTAKGPMNTSAADAAGVAPAISAIAAPAPANALLVRVPMFTVPFASIPAVDLSPSMSFNLRARSPFRCSACQRVSEHRSYRRTDERCDRQVAHGPRAAVLSPLRQCSPATHGASRPTPTANRSRRHARQPPSGRSTSCTTSLRRRNHGVKGGSNRANLGGPAATSPARAIPASRSAR